MSQSKPQIPIFLKMAYDRSKIKRDAASAFESIDLEPSFEAVKTGEAVDDSVLLRVEKVINDHSMPPLSYTILRPGSAVSSKERVILKEWLTLH